MCSSIHDLYISAHNIYTHNTHVAHIHDTHITHIQGSVEREYIGFVCKEDSMHKLFCHMLKADDSKVVSSCTHSSTLMNMLNNGIGQSGGVCL